MIKKIIRILFVASLLISKQECFAQELLSELPSTREEFIASEKKVLATIDWLEATPFDEQVETRNTQKALLIAWLTNSPTVTLQVDADVLKFTRKNPDLLVIFMGGWTRHALQNNYSADNVQDSLAGIKSAIQVYKNFSLKKDKEMDKLIELDSRGELENWVKEKMTKK